VPGYSEVIQSDRRRHIERSQILGGRVICCDARWDREEWKEIFIIITPVELAAALPPRQSA
jgi:hypothetical protein